jgi:large subunit ribosomal protein L21
MRTFAMYAIVRTGGKQYRVEEGRSVIVERLPAAEGDRVELSDVLMIAADGEVTVGTPTIEGARVVADVEENGRGKKIIVFKYKAKVRTRKKTGHRQNFTRLAVQEILLPGQTPKAKPKRRARAADEELEAEQPEIDQTASGSPEVEEAEAAPKRQARIKPAEATTEGKPKRSRPKNKPETSSEADEKPARRTRRKADETGTE